MLLAAVLLTVCPLAAQAETTVSVGTSTITVAMPERELAASREQILGWVRRCGESVSDYFGRLPVPAVRLELTSTPGRGARSGRTWNGRLIRLSLGAGTREEDLRDDWTLTHELCHLAFPDLDEHYAWIYEGYATWVEPVIRARAGLLKPEQFWRETLEGMPKGLPGPKDEGLDGTKAWGRTYWGGALFWMSADLEIRERTRNKHSLQTVLRAVLDAGGDGAHRWSVDQLLAKGDEATGTTVLRDFYARMGEAPYRADLPALWKSLGVERRGGDLVFDDDAPRASLRRALTARPATQ
jgi:hypothetical protein